MYVKKTLATFSLILILFLFAGSINCQKPTPTATPQPGVLFGFTTAAVLAAHNRQAQDVSGTIAILRVKPPSIFALTYGLAFSYQRKEPKPDTKPPDRKPPDTKPPDTKPPDTKPPTRIPPVRLPDCPNWDGRGCTLTNFSGSPQTAPDAVASSADFAIAPMTISPCRPDEVLVGEDERNWYCATVLPFALGVRSLEKFREGLLGEQWKYRKAMIESVAALMRPEKGIKARNGGKLLVTPAGFVEYRCVAPECREAKPSVDCSGATAYGQLSACLVNEVYKATFIELKSGVDNKASGQASFFSTHQSFLAKSSRPTPGDLVFFKDTVRKSPPPAGTITHVAIYVGKDQKRGIMILHASQREDRVLFTWIQPDSFLGTRIMGYGDTSKLVKNLSGRNP